MLISGPNTPELAPPQRVLMGPGPTNLPPTVSQALLAPLTGHKDPYFLQVMDQTAALLRYIFQTENETSMSLPGTGGAGMEAAIGNLLQPGDAAVVCINGMFGARMAEIARRSGAEVIEVSAPWGRPIDTEDVRKALSGRKVRIVTVVHGETSTGVVQPMEALGEISRQAGAFFVVDAVATLGGGAGLAGCLECCHLLRGEPKVPVGAARPGANHHQFGCYELCPGAISCSARLVL